ARGATINIAYDPLDRPTLRNLPFWTGSSWSAHDTTAADGEEDVVYEYDGHVAASCNGYSGPSNPGICDDHCSNTTDTCNTNTLTCVHEGTPCAFNGENSEGTGLSTAQQQALGDCTQSSCSSPQYVDPYQYCSSSTLSHPACCSNNSCCSSGS